MLNDGPMATPNNDYLQRSLDSLRSAAAVDFRFNFVTSGTPAPSFVAANHYTSGAPAFFYANRNNVIIEPSDLRFFGGGGGSNNNGTTAVSIGSGPGAGMGLSSIPTSTSNNDVVDGGVQRRIAQQQQEHEHEQVKEETHNHHGDGGEDSVDSCSTPSPVSVGESAITTNHNNNNNNFVDDKVTRVSVVSKLFKGLKRIRSLWLSRAPFFIL